MSIKHLVSAFAGARKYTIWHQDPMTGQVHLETRQDVEPIIEFCKARRENVKDDPEFRHVAEVPMSIVGQWMREGSLDDEAHIRRWVNDPQNRDFRTWPGRI